VSCEVSLFIYIILRGTIKFISLVLVCAHSDLYGLSTVGDSDVGQLGTKMAPEAI